MADTSGGLNKAPGRVSSLQSRLYCRTCHAEPSEVSADVKEGVVTFTVKCHGESVTKVVMRTDNMKGHTIELFIPKEN